MNRLINHIILWALVIVVMAACGGGSDAPTTVPAPTPTPTPTPDPDPTPQPTPEPQQIPIGFRVDLSDVVAGTRSVGDGEYKIDNNKLRTDGFGVFCWYTGAADFDKPKLSENMLMRNQKVEFVGTQWTYSPSKYWPLDPSEKLTFRAYAPYTDYMVTDDNGTPSLPVVLGTETDEEEGVVYGIDYQNGTQHDPLFGTDIHGRKYTDVTYMKSGDDLEANDSRDGTVHWYFHHGMAKLLFYAKYDKNASEDSVYVTNITISALYDKGLLSIESQSDTTYNAETHAIETITKPVWSDRSGEMTVDISQFYNKRSGTYQDYFTIRKDDTSDSGENIDMIRLVTQPGLLIIPRDYIDEDGKRLVLSVTYKRRKEDERTYTVKTTIPVQTFLGNTVYAMRLTVGSALVAEISSVNVAKSNWNEEEENHEVYNW